MPPGEVPGGRDQGTCPLEIDVFRTTFINIIVSSGELLEMGGS